MKVIHAPILEEIEHPYSLPNGKEIPALFCTVHNLTKLNVKKITIRMLSSNAFSSN